jgi:hypothetical protein
MRWLLACQKSGLLRQLLREMGHDAWTCDLEPAEDGSEFHITRDVLKVLEDCPECDGTGNFYRNDEDNDNLPCDFCNGTGNPGWDAMFACPGCRHLCSSGHHRTGKPGQRTAKDVEDAVDFFMRLACAPIKLKAVENSVGIMSTRWRKPDQIIQPYQFGDDASKGTCLWFEGLPKLIIDPAQYVQPRIVDGKKRWANQTDSGQNRLGPSPTRSADRARNYPGIVRAMAAQWGSL